MKKCDIKFYALRSVRMRCCEHFPKSGKCHGCDKRRMCNQFYKDAGRFNKSLVDLDAVKTYQKAAIVAYQAIRCGVRLLQAIKGNGNLR